MKLQKNTYIKDSTVKLMKAIVFIIALCGMSDGPLSQVPLSQVSCAGGNSDNLIILSKNSTHMLNIEVSKETLVNISLFDESDQLADILLYEYVKPGIFKYDLAMYFPTGNFTCKITIGENTEVIKLVVI